MQLFELRVQREADRRTDRIIGTLARELRQCDTNVVDEIDIIAESTLQNILAAAAFQSVAATPTDQVVLGRVAFNVVCKAIARGIDFIVAVQIKVLNSRRARRMKT